MNQEETLAIIKPNAVKERNTGSILAQIEKAGFKIKALQMIRLRLADAKAFYAIHAERFFYHELCSYMASAPVVIILLEKENAIADFRRLLGATDPSKAEPGTLRCQFGTSIDDNAVHGSDALETAQREINFFFKRKSCCKKNCC